MSDPTSLERQLGELRADMSDEDVRDLPRHALGHALILNNEREAAGARARDLVTDAPARALDRSATM